MRYYEQGDLQLLVCDWGEDYLGFDIKRENIHIFVMEESDYAYIQDSYIELNWPNYLSKPVIAALFTYSAKDKI